VLPQKGTSLHQQKPTPPRGEKNMENIYAAMLLHKAGKEINEETVTSVLTAAGITVDAVQIKALVASLSEVNIDEAIKAAPTMMAAAPVAAAAPAEEKPAAAPEDKKKKAEDEKAKEEAALEGLGALFG
jgi:large subunit ribosomal protein L12